MQIVQGYRNPSRDPVPGVTLALGNFDGVHLGHQAVIDAAREAAPGAPLAVASFEPHPRAFFAPDSPPFRLTLLPEKARKLSALGVETLFVIDFDAALSKMTPEQFVSEVLVDGIGVAAVAIGSDFRFGAGRAGDAATLASFGARHGFQVSALKAIGDESGALYSSSAARQALRDGRPGDAAAILGASHRIRGRVEKGDQRGRLLEFPTANLALDGILSPKFGVYAVEAEILDGPHQGQVRGVANLGLRPTFEKTVPILEAHLFDFEGDLYGAEIAVSLIEFLRPEQKFDGLDALRAQIARDAATARALL